MPRDFITLSDMPQAVLGVTWDLCQRRESFDVEALKAQHGGDVKMPELLSRLVAAPQAAAPRARMGRSLGGRPTPRRYDDAIARGIERQGEAGTQLASPSSFLAAWIR
jgi:hypothetical protein